MGAAKQLSQTTGLPAASATTATATATGPIVGHVDVEGSTVELATVHLLDGGVSVFSVVEGDKTETTAAAGVSVVDDFGFCDCSVNLEGLTKAVIISSPAQATNKKFLRHISSLFLPTRQTATSL